MHIDAGDPPVVSLEALQAAFNHLPYAIAVVRVAADGSVTSSGNCIDDGHSSAQVLPGGDASLPITISHDVAAGPPALMMEAPLMAGACSGAANSRHPPEPSLFAGSSSLYTAMDDNRELAISSHAGSSSCHADSTFAVRVPNQSGWHLEEQELAYATSQTNAGALQQTIGPQPLYYLEQVDKEDAPRMARLQPVYLNAAVEQMLEMNGYAEFSSYMDTQLHRNPMLVMMLESSVQRLMRGVATSVKQYMPTFQSTSSTDSAAQPPFISLQISSCGFEDADGTISPGLFLWYNAPSKQLELTSQLKRDYMALAHVPSMISVVAMDGRVLHQNSSSVAYMGFAMGSLGSQETRHISSMHHNLRRLFCLEPDALMDMLNAVADGKAPPGSQADCSNEACLSATRKLSAPHAAAPVTTSVSSPAHTPAAATGPRRRRMSLEIPHNISFSKAPAVHNSATNSTMSNVLLNSRAMQMLLGSKAAQSKADGSRPAQLKGQPRRVSSELRRASVGLSQSANTTKWHQVQANRFRDPVTGEDVIMIIQTDMTPQILAEQQLRQVLDAEHVLLEEIFPRQVLEVMTAASIRKHISSSTVIVGMQCNATSGNRIKLSLQHEQVSILFADIVGFTAMSKQVEPAVVMAFLNDLYTEFDLLLEEYTVYKVETIGDCYMVAGGLVFTDSQGFRTALQSQVDPLHAQRTLLYALALLVVASRVVMPHTGLPVQLRIGIHSGPVTSGVVGAKMPRFCLFGDAVNTAHRMESCAPPGRIQVTDFTRGLVGGEFWEPSGGAEIKGIGLMDTYYFDATHVQAQQQLEAMKAELGAQLRDSKGFIAI
eukprot:gene10666-10825_t